MPTAKEIAAFDMQRTSIKVMPEPGGGRSFELNLEGKVTGAWTGTALCTMSVKSDDFKTGTYSITVAGYLDSGGTVTAIGSGTLKALGGHKWLLRGNDITSDGHSTSTEGELDLASRSYKGKVFE
jgi:hypothetical protein